MLWATLQGKYRREEERGEVALLFISLYLQLDQGMQYPEQISHKGHQAC